MLFVENGSDVAQYTLQLVVQLVLQNVEFLLIKMNRYIFIFTIIAILVLGLYMDSNDMRYYAGFTVFLLSVIAVSIRRIYLKLKPWWGAPLKDIPKYFTKP